MPRPRTLRSLASALALVSLAAAAAHEEISDHIEHTHDLVRIGSTSLHPATLEIGTDDAFGWLNYSDQIATVAFPASVAKQMRCRQRSSFHLAGENIVSGDIQARQFVSLCSLAPGEYAYQVTLRAGIGGSGPGAGRTLAGRLVVR